MKHFMYLTVDQSGSEEEEEDEKMSKPDPEEEEKKKERMDKKRKLKEMFDAEYDEGDATYFDNLKEEMHRQAQVQTVNLAIYLTIHLQKQSLPKGFFLEINMTFRSCLKKYTQRSTCLPFFYGLTFLFHQMESKQTKQVKA